LLTVVPSNRDLEAEYKQAVSFLYSLERFGILLGLKNITSLLGKLGNPQNSFRVVHVAGSNGKGSTASYISNIAQRAGLKTALYTSPHLNDFRERIRVNGRMVSKEALVTSSRRIQELYDPERTTFFEFTTAVAFDCMAQAKPDLAIVEVGLGGRLDATNVVEPDVSVITDISREHVDYLGEGIASIAREKAGIVKHGVPLVTGASRKDARQVILDTAQRLSAPVKEFGRDFKGLRVSQDSFTYQSKSLTLEKLVTGLTGSHQIKNASLAVAVAEEMIKKNYPITIEAIRQGVEGTFFPGRFEVLRKRPDVVIDGAHTLEGMRLLKSSFRRIYPRIKPLMLLGILKDKNYPELVRIISSIAREVVCVPPQGNRALDPEELAAHVREQGVGARAFGDIIQGFDKLMELSGPQDVILATGSLYMIGPVRRACGIEDA
jgi:dihydrofolate synthase / folylpolyglutamate synthase